MSKAAYDPEGIITDIRADTYWKEIRTDRKATEERESAALAQPDASSLDWLRYECEGRSAAAKRARTEPRAMVDYVELHGDTTDRMEEMGKEFKETANQASAFGTYPVLLANIESTDTVEAMDRILQVLQHYGQEVAQQIHAQAWCMHPASYPCSTRTLISRGWWRSLNHSWNLSSGTLLLVGGAASRRRW